MADEPYNAAEFARLRSGVEQLAAAAERLDVDRLLGLIDDLQDGGPLFRSREIPWERLQRLAKAARVFKSHAALYSGTAERERTAEAQRTQRGHRA